MLFTDHFFLLYFFPAVFVIHTLILRLASISYANMFLIGSSLFFYSTFSVVNVGVFLVTLLLDYVIGYALGRTVSIKGRRLLLTFGIISTLLFLLYFKYRLFFAQAFGIPETELIFFHTQSDLMIPVGISFITFQRISYIVDIYRKKIEPEMNIIRYATYAALFPHLIAGPIVRYSEIRGEVSCRVLTNALAYKGMGYVACGLAFKILIADQLFPYEEVLKSGLASLSGLEAWLLVLVFSLRIYFDFSGYSLMAIGLAYLLGFTFPHNFYAPYRAASMRDFWRRWNITLSRWLRDYVYIPLGGNRKGRIRTYINILVTMLIGGLWHGASWNFVLWGGLHGLYQIADDSAGRWFSSASTVQKHNDGVKNRLLNQYKKAGTQMIVFVLVSLAWLGFVFADWRDAWHIITRLPAIQMQDIFTVSLHREWWFAAVAGMMGICIIRYFDEEMLERLPNTFFWSMVISIVFVISLGVALQSGGVPFIYFQF